MRSAFSRFASGTESASLSECLAELSPEDVDFHLHDWLVQAREDQLPPLATVPGAPWQTWLILGGRGAGKTRTGAEWVRAMALGHAPFAEAAVGRIALVAETMHDARAVMVEGVSGLLAIHHPRERPRFESSRGQLEWPNGAIAQLFSADDPDSLRGPQFGAAWADEIAKWRYGEAAWDMLQFALRLGTHPRQVVTTTPRPLPLLRRLMADPATVVTRASTRDNEANLAANFIASLERRYAGTLLARQELDGEIIEDAAGALWRRDWIEQARCGGSPELQRVVVAVDPPVTATAQSDACGIIVAGLGPDGRGYVVADRSLQGREPMQWAAAAVAAYHDFAADRIVAETNQGGDLVETLIRQVDASLPVRQVKATRGKWMRAEPVAALYAQGRVAHVGVLAELEDEMCAFGVDGRARGRSPDRLDALVWALTDLMLAAPAQPSVRAL